MRTKFLSAALTAGAGFGAAAILLAALSCQGSGGPVTVTGSGTSRAYSQPRPGQPETGAVPTDTPLGADRSRPTATPLPSNVLPTATP